MPYWFDGNNLVGQPAATLRSDRRTRQAFLDLLSQLHIARGGAFEVFFDGDDPDRARSPRGVRVRYCAPLSADDAIVDRLAGVRAAAEVTVVTNDHRLTRRCRDAGARTKNWGEFTSAIKDRRGGKEKEKEERVDVDDWARFFGMDDGAIE